MDKRWVSWTAAAALLLAFAAPHTAAQRSFVGKRLPIIEFTDTEGHLINPAHYKGSVLVMLAGIPW